MTEVELRLPPRVQYVSLARQVVKAAARQAGMDEEHIGDLEIAVSEATTNAILAHNRHGRDPAILLRFGPAAGGFEVAVCDEGPGFDPPPGNGANVAEDEPDWPIEGGLGLTVIRGLADDVRFSREDGMRVLMRFALAGELPEPA